SGDALMTIINDILDFSKIESGQLKIEDTDFHLNWLVETSAEVMAEQSQRKKIELLIWVERNVPQWFCGDSGRLRQVLVNLVGNAIKFTDEGEVLLHVTLEEENDEVATIRFEIRDTGIGISNEALGSLFRPFTQA